MARDVHTLFKKNQVFISNSGLLDLKVSALPSIPKSYYQYNIEN